LKILYSINIKDAQKVFQENQDVAKAKANHKAKRGCQC
jgi:hypothetical protein